MKIEEKGKKDKKTYKDIKYFKWEKENEYKNKYTIDFYNNFGTYEKIESDLTYISECIENINKNIEEFEVKINEEYEALNTIKSVNKNLYCNLNNNINVYLKKFIQKYNNIDYVFEKVSIFMQILKYTHLDQIENIIYNNKILNKKLKERITQFNLSENNLIKVLLKFLNKIKLDKNAENIFKKLLQDNFLKYLVAKNIKLLNKNDEIVKEVINNNKYFNKYKYNNILAKYKKKLSPYINEVNNIRKKINIESGNIEEKIIDLSGKEKCINLDQINNSNITYKEKEKVSNKIYTKIYEIYKREYKKLGKNILSIYLIYYKFVNEINEENLLEYMPEYFSRNIRNSLVTEIKKQLSVKKEIDIKKIKSNNFEKTWHNIKNVNIKKEENKNEINNENIADIEITEEKRIDQYFKYIKNSLKIFPKEYIEILKKVLKENKIDLYDRKNKILKNITIGQYILISGNGNISNMYTLIHEISHLVENILKRKDNSKYKYYDFKIDLETEFFAIVNEAILYLSLNKEEKIDKLIKDFEYKNVVSIFKYSEMIEFQEKIFKYFKNKEKKLNIEIGEKDIENIANEYEKITLKYVPENIILDKNLKYEWIYSTPIKNPYSTTIYLISKLLNKDIAEKLMNKKIDNNIYYKIFKNINTNPENKYIRMKQLGIDIFNEEILKKKIKEYFEKI